MSIKTRVFGFLLAAGSFALAAPAMAYHGSPVSTTFTGTGPTSLTYVGLPVACTSTFVLVTDAAGNATVTGATFTGSSTCTSLVAHNLPWSVTINSLTAATINNVSVTGPLGISCAGSASASINSAASQIGLSGSLGACTISGTLAAAPAFQVLN